MKTISLLFAGLLLCCLTACKKEDTTKTSSSVAPQAGCRACHADLRLDKKHDFACPVCHQGNNRARDKAAAHTGLSVHPAAPAQMAQICGTCHAQQVTNCEKASHFTLNNEVTLIRRHFGLEPLADLTAIPERSDPPHNKEQLVDDLLRRRCLRCHVYTAGDSYPYVQRGTGCAACHIQKIEGKLKNHTFTLPNEQQCLSCHYGNYVGSDFAGMYEHDYGRDFRSPQATPRPFLRPYGVEQHDLAQDIHRQRGLTCIDCHSGKELSGQQAAITCTDCHAPEANRLPQLQNVRFENGQLILTGRQDNKEHPVPLLKNPAHTKYGKKIACQVCHAQWSVNDQSTHLLLNYSDDIELWETLAVQSSSEAESFLNGEEYAPVMSDAITGTKKQGVWLQGYKQRRWENMLIRKDNDGIIKVFRPILDLHLSAIDEQGDIIANLDNVVGQDDGLRPYTPHTTGPAGLFYEQRFLHLLQDTKAAQPSTKQTRE
jgi:hypothetical protein